MLDPPKQTWNKWSLQVYISLRVIVDLIPIEERLTLKTSALENPYGGQYTLSTQMIKPNDPIKIYFQR